MFSGERDSPNEPVEQSRNFNGETIGPLFKAEIDSIKQFNFSYFREISLPLVKYSGEDKDFDLILRLTGSDEREDKFRHRFGPLTLISQQKLTPGVFKVRGIAKIKWTGSEGEIIANDYTWAIRIPEYMRSYSEAGANIPDQVQQASVLDHQT